MESGSSVDSTRQPDSRAPVLTQHALRGGSGFYLCFLSSPEDIFSLFFFFKDFIYLFLEIVEGRKKEVEKHQCVVASHSAPTGDLAHSPGMCPDWESNP